MTEEQTMTSNRPYLLRAVYDWLLDNDMTPYLLVNVEREGVRVPKGFAEDGRIVLNISPGAVKALDLGNDMIYFNARFGGRPMDVFIPPHAVMGLYAKENGRGMLFPDEPEPQPQPAAGPERPRPSVISGGKGPKSEEEKAGKRPNRAGLRLVK